MTRRRPARPLTVPPELRPEVLALLITKAERDMTRQNGLRPAIAGLDEFLASLRTAASGKAAAILPPRTAYEELTTREAAGLMNVTTRRVRQLAQAGVIIARKQGRDWAVDATAAADYRRRAL